MTGSAQTSYTTFHEFVKSTCREVGSFRYECDEDDAYQLMQLAAQLGADADSRPNAIVLDFEDDETLLSVNIFQSSGTSHEIDFDSSEALGAQPVELEELEFVNTAETSGVEAVDEVTVETVVVDEDEAAVAKPEAKKRGAMFYVGIAGVVTLVLGGAAAAGWWYLNKKKAEKAAGVIA